MTTHLDLKLCFHEQHHSLVPNVTKDFACKHPIGAAEKLAAARADTLDDHLRRIHQAGPKPRAKFGQGCSRSAPQTRATQTGGAKAAGGGNFHEEMHDEVYRVEWLYTSG